MTGLATEQVWLPKGEWIEWPTGKHFSGPASVERSFTIDADSGLCEGRRDCAHAAADAAHRREAGRSADCECVAAGARERARAIRCMRIRACRSSTRRGVFARTPIKAAQTGDTLRVEIGPVEGSYPGMLKTRGYELRLPADWPPVSVTVNGKALKPVKPGEPGGWALRRQYADDDRFLCRPRAQRQKLWSKCGARKD